MHALEAKIPPLAAAFSAAVLMWFIAWAVPAFGIRIPWRGPISALLVAAGAVISASGILSFRRVGTTVNPMNPNASSSLVAFGVYRMSRNPMYLGFFFILAGWAVFLSNALSFLLAPAFVIYMNRFQIEPEERALEAKFGREFAMYKSRVRRWI